jgi:hypothetical protein
LNWKRNQKRILYIYFQCVINLVILSGNFCSSLIGRKSLTQWKLTNNLTIFWRNNYLGGQIITLNCLHHIRVKLVSWTQNFKKTKQTRLPKLQPIISNCQFKKFSCSDTWDNTSSINCLQLNSTQTHLSHQLAATKPHWRYNILEAEKLRLCHVLNFCNSWAKGSPSPTWKSTNKTYCIIAGKLIKKITLLALKCFCTTWDIQLTMVDFSTKCREWTAVSTRHHIWPSVIICQIACKFRQRRQRLII